MIEKEFTAIVRQHIYFHCAMISLVAIEMISLFCLINLAPKSYSVATCLALLLVTLFSYFILHSYFETKKPQQYRSLKDSFLSSLKEAIGDPNDHFSIAKGLFRATPSIEAVTIPAFYPFKWVADKLLLKDQSSLQESLMIMGLQEYHEMIKKNPTDLKCHTALANAYFALSRLYSSPSLQKKHDAVIKMAIEELKILDDSAPNDPWVHAHLASAYHKTHQKEEEVKEYEILKNLCPEDPHILCKLGKLYFELGLHSKGMRIYDKLKNLSSSEAASLIHFYDMQFNQVFQNQ